MDTNENQIDNLTWLADFILSNAEKVSLPGNDPEISKNHETPDYVGAVKLEYMEMDPDEMPSCSKLCRSGMTKALQISGGPKDTNINVYEEFRQHGIVQKSFENEEGEVVGKCPKFFEPDDEMIGLPVPAAQTRTTSTEAGKHAEDFSNHCVLDASPCGVFLKFNKIIGKGSVKTVYYGLDSHTGIQVAWCEFIRKHWTKKDRRHFYNEGKLLTELQHPNIIQCRTYWEGADKTKPSVIITELMTSGTLKEYIKHFKKVDLKTVKTWSWQILKGLHYLHTRTPLIIHRDLKCDNIFITGATGCVKIGDLGLATRKVHGFARSVVGTPEFMAPEIYEGYYNESVDVYAFGMCMIEMFTEDYPYSECLHPMQIYEYVIAGRKPRAYFKIEDPTATDIIKWCIEKNKRYRPTCLELLHSEFFFSTFGNAFLDEHHSLAQDTQKGQMKLSFEDDPMLSASAIPSISEDKQLLAAPGTSTEASASQNIAADDAVISTMSPSNHTTRRVSRFYVTPVFEGTTSLPNDPY